MNHCLTAAGEQPALPFSHDHDLPPRWDGALITWAGWCDPIPTTWNLHRPGQDRCEGCGHRGETASNLGTIHHALTALDGQASRRAGLTTALCAYRCPVCHLDTVIDLTTGEAWILDESDYHDEGSNE